MQRFPSSSRALRRALASVLLVGGAALAAPAYAAQCFSMFDFGNRLLYQSTRTPIDLSQPVSQEMRSLFPSRYLVIWYTTSCPESGTLSDRTIELNDASVFPRSAAAAARRVRRSR